MEYDGQQCPTKINDGQRNAGLVQGGRRFRTDRFELIEQRLRS